MPRENDSRKYEEIANRQYKEISLIDHLIALKKNKKIIFFVTLVISGATLFLSLGTTKKMYEGDIFISIGNVKDELVETPDQLGEVISLADNSITINQGKSGKAIALTLKAETQDELQKRIEKLITFISLRHSNIIEKKIKKKLMLSEGRASFLTEHLQKENERMNNLQAIINHLNPFDYAQAVSLQTYMKSYDDTLVRKFQLEDELQKLNSEKLDSEETSIQKGDVKTISPLGKILSNTIIAIIIGFIIGVFYAFIKEWWKANKGLVK